MSETVNLVLRRDDIGQILDGLTQRMLVWRATAEYLETGQATSADYIEECSHAHEANSIADYYEAIIEEIRKQLPDYSSKS